MSLQFKLESLGLTAHELDSLDRAKFDRLHRPVGKIKLYSMEQKVNKVLELYGYSERVSVGKYRSVYKPEMLEKPLVRFCSPKSFQPKDKGALNLAIKRVMKKFAKLTTSPISLEESYQRLLDDKADHFAGLPTLGSKGDDEFALERAKQCWSGKCPPPPVIGHRGKNLDESRVVLMFPFEWHIVEAAFYFPLYDIIKRSQTIYPVGAISERRYTMRKYSDDDKFNTKFSIDYSGYDASLGTQMIGIAFKILSSMLRLSNKEQKVWERVQTFFATSPFLAPDGKVYKGRRGSVPSGSMFTQVVDTLCNAVAIEYSMICEKVKNYRYLVYGDDSWTILNIGEEPRVFLQKIEQHVRSLGLKMNVDKTVYATPSVPIVFCGHYDIKRGRPLQDAIDKLVYPERPSRDLTTREGLCERVVAYMADADLLILNAVFLSYYYNQSVDWFVNFGTGKAFTEVAEQSVQAWRKRRSLPGILQVIELAPREASSLMKIRGAI